MGPININIECDFDKCCPRKLKMNYCCCSSKSTDDVFDPEEKESIERVDQVANETFIEEKEMVTAIQVIKTPRKAVKKNESIADRHIRNRMCIIF